MINIDQLKAFVIAAEQGSFSAAARKLGKAQSAVSTSVSNLEVDSGVELFDRSARNPVLSEAGKSLLPYALSVLQSRQEFTARATSLSEGLETNLSVAIEQGIFVPSLVRLFSELENLFPFIEIELLDPGIQDVAVLLKQGRADIGIMMEQESYPQGFYFRGIGHSPQIPVCSPSHPLAKNNRIYHADLRLHRQLLTRSRSLESNTHQREQKSPKVWFAESPYMIVELLSAGLGWAELPWTVVKEKLENKELVRLHYDFQQSDILRGVDVAWTERKALGSVGQWLLDKLLGLEAGLWSG